MKEIPSTNTDHPTSSDAPQTPPTGFKSLLACWTKLNNDWVLSFASGLAYSLIVALIPITIAMIALAGFIYGRLDPTIQTDLITTIQHAFPEPIPSEEIVSLALDTLNKNAGLLGIIAIVGAVIGGSGLFVSMEGYFDIIYRTHTRGLVQQYVMAVGMILLFVLLTPLMSLQTLFLPSCTRSCKELPSAMHQGSAFLLTWVASLLDRFSAGS